MPASFYLLPGMGADSAMYQGPWRELDWVQFLDWPVYRGETTLKAVAERIVDENNIQPGDGVGGSSLGGMVALEIARLRPVATVALIGSATTREEINPLLRAAAPFASLTPLRLAQLLAGKSVDGPIAECFTRSDPRFIRAMCRALTEWEGGIRAKPSYSLFRIHGESDLVIPCPWRGTEVIPRAGHLIAVTHPVECVEFVSRV